jgi:hypothetical protein
MVPKMKKNAKEQTPETVERIFFERKRSQKPND